MPPGVSDAGFENTAMTVDVSQRDSVLALVQAADDLGEVTGLIHAAGVSPSQAAPEMILRVDLYGTALSVGVRLPGQPVREEAGRSLLSQRRPLSRTMRNTAAATPAAC